MLFSFLRAFGTTRYTDWLVLGCGMLNLLCFSLLCCIFIFLPFIHYREIKSTFSVPKGVVLAVHIPSAVKRFELHYIQVIFYILAG